MDSFISSLRSLSILRIAVLKFLSWASATLHFSGLITTVLLETYYTGSYWLYFMLMCKHLGLKLLCFYIIIFCLLAWCFIPFFLMPPLDLKCVVGVGCLVENMFEFLWGVASGGLFLGITDRKVWGWAWREELRGATERKKAEPASDLWNPHGVESLRKDGPLQLVCYRDGDEIAEFVIEGKKESKNWLHDF